MESMYGHDLVYCGNKCTVCPHFRDGGCGGCRTGKILGSCRSCEPRKCARERKVETCGHCADFPCPKLDAMYAAWTRDGFGEGAIICRGILEGIGIRLRDEADAAAR